MVKDLNMQRRDFIYLFVIAWFSLFYLKSCRDMVGIEKNLMSVQDTVKTYRSKNGDLVSYNNAIKTELDDLKLYNIDLKNELKDMKIKKPEFVTKVVYVTRIDSVSYVFRDTLPCDDFVENVVIDSSFYYIDMTITKDSLTVNDIIIPNEQIVTMGVKKNGLFKRNEYVFAIKNTNPNIVVEKIDSYAIKDKMKIIEHPLIHEAIGAGLALFLISLTK